MELQEAKGGNIPLISGYGEGGFRVLDERIEGHLLICPEGFCAWQLKSEKNLTKQSLKPLSESGFEAAFILLGLGEAIDEPVLLARKYSKALGSRARL